MKNVAWLAVLALALLKQDFAAGSATSPLLFSAPDTSDMSRRSGDPRPDLLRLPGRLSRTSPRSYVQTAYIRLAAVIAHNYVSSFAKDENPLSEGGSWIDGKAVGLDWADVRTVSGVASGVSLPSKYADPTALLSGDWGSDQQAEGTVRVKTRLTGCCREVELRLRSTIKAHSITGYEILCSISVSSPYLEIVRWNGPLNDFTYISRGDIGCADGDVLKAVVVGDVISVHKNGVKVLEGTDRHFASGSPGIGFYESRDDVWSRLGFTSWTQFGFSRFSATDDLRAP